jgi:chromosome partitioning protein
MITVDGLSVNAIHTYTGTQGASMRVWTVQNQKGGAGKSTVVTMLAAYAEQCGETTLIIDLDPQPSCIDWHEQRGTNKPMVLAGLPEKLPDLLQSALNFGVSLVLIDTAPHSTDIAIAAIKQADLIIVPMLSGLFEETGLRGTAQCLSVAGAFSKAVGIPNKVPSTSQSAIAQELTDSRAQLEKFGIKPSPRYLCDRIAFRRCLSKGQAVTEYKPADHKAIDEVQQLWSYLNGLSPITVDFLTPKAEERAA